MQYKVNVTWTNDKANFDYDTYNRNHLLAFNGGQVVGNSSAKEFVGDETKSNPEELLAGALSTCHMLTFLAVCSKKKMHILSYQDEAIAYLEKNAEGKMSVAKIDLHPKVIFQGAAPSEAELLSLHEKAHANCFIANSIKCHIYYNGQNLDH